MLSSQTFQESAERKIVIEDFEPSIVEAMLRFMYSFDYQTTSDIADMIFHATVYQVADKYDIPTLKQLSSEKFNASIGDGWQSDDFPSVVKIIYETTPLADRGLRDLAIEVTRKNIDKLLVQENFTSMLREVADFSADLIPFLSHSDLQAHQCSSCRHVLQYKDNEDQHRYCYMCGTPRSNWGSWGR